MNAFRVAITHSDGSELERVVYISDKVRAKVEKIEADIVSIVQGGDAPGEAALANVFYRIFTMKVPS